jgi:regulator of nucleoside diphosphate kinase
MRIKQQMPSKQVKQAGPMPEIFLSSHDFERLEALADKLPDAQVEGKAAFLEELSRASVVAPDDMPPDTVTMNSIVRFKVDGREFCKTLVYPRDAVDGENRVSIITPVGMALIGLQRGAIIEWPRAAGGALEIEILEVLYQPEKFGDFRR